MTTLSIKLAQSHWGRATLHLICLLSGGNVRWHWSGIKRELTH